MNSLLDTLRARGWEVRTASDPAPLLPAAVAARYPRLPADLLVFLSALEACHSKDETAWFLTREDFARADGEGFRWNEYECMAKDACDADGDRTAVQQVERFWNEHFPFMLAVHSDYDYLALRLSDGSVVHGYAPCWEEPSVVAPSFVALLRGFEAAASSPDPDYPYRVFLGAPGDVEAGYAGGGVSL